MEQERKKIKIENTPEIENTSNRLKPNETKVKNEIPSEAKEEDKKLNANTELTANETKSVKTNHKKDTKKIGNGKLLEYRIQRLLFHMGYITKTGIEITTSLDEDFESITDLDVFGIYIHKDFRFKSIWADCKSGRARPLERISWINGVKSLASIDDVLFVKSGVKSSIKKFAKNNDVQILDIGIIDRLEIDFKVDKDNWTGSWNYNLFDDNIVKFSRLKTPNNDIYKKISKFISTDFWSVDKYTGLKKSITAMKELAKIPLENLPSTDRKLILWGIYQIVTLFTISLFKIIREVYYYTDYERKETLHDGIISGEISIKKRQELIAASYRLAFELIKAQNPGVVPPTQQVNISPPAYFESLNDLVTRITMDPLRYFDLVRVLDYSLLEYDIQDKNWDIDRLGKMFENIDENLHGVKTILHFICQTTSLPKSIFKVLKN